MLKIEYLEEEIEVYDITVENMHNFYANNILVHNCTEIFEPSRPSKVISEECITRENGKKEIIKKYGEGEIALCNLASVNLVEMGKLTEPKLKALIYDVVSLMDNSIDVAFYPVKEGMLTNQRYRYLGIGVNNFANYLATKKVVIDSEDALTMTHVIFDTLSYHIISASNQLAIDKGAFRGFYETEWSKGKIPLDFANLNALSLGNYIPDIEKWSKLAEKIRLHGIRNALLMAIAPTATSGKAISATESIEPIQNLFYREEGTQSIATVVPNFRKNNKYYKKSFDCDQRRLIELAAIRQCYLDQGQSINLYYKHPDSLLELTEHHFYGFELGLKSFYYLKQVKSVEENECESCS